MPMKMINIRIEQDLWHEIKIEAVKQNKTLQKFVSEALEKALERTNQKK